MRIFRSILIAAVLAPFAACALAAPAPANVRAEIDALIAKLASSGCSFNRNGTWHSAADAKVHLLRKLAYLEDKDLVQTTEHFIERAAAGSSTSGKAYLVRCGSAPAVESKAWLTQALATLRGGKS
jgi:hypothetical protein